MCIYYGGQLCVPHSTCWYTRCQLCAYTYIVGGQLCAPTLVWFPNPLTPEIHVRWATQCFTSLRHLLLLFHNQVMCNYEHCSLNNRVRYSSRICSTHAGILRSNTTLWPLDIFCIAHHLTLGLYVIRCNTVALSSLLHEVIGHYYGTSSPGVSNKPNNRHMRNKIPKYL